MVLVVTRKVGQEIVIGGTTFVRVLKRVNGQVVLGITAPKDVTIDRGEVDHRIRNGEHRRDGRT